MAGRRQAPEQAACPGKETQMSSRASTVYLSLGANLGDRAAMLGRAVDALAALQPVRILRTSAVYESEPWGLIEQPKFLNIMAEIETALTPLELLYAVKSVEQQLGREPAPRWGPRCVDIDLILWADVILRTPELTLPHERFRERAFVLTPLAELAPDAVDPETGSTMAALAGRLDETGLVRYAEPICS